MVPAMFKAAIIDLDGVVWLGSKPIESNIEFIRRAMESGVDVVFLTNNSTRSRRVYSARLRHLGIEADESRIINSGYSAAKWLSEKFGECRVYPVGEEGLVEELVLAGHTVVTASDAPRYADAVVVGLDRGLTYGKLRAAVRAILNGAVFVATNLDHVIPVADGVDPGAGAIVSAIERATLRSIDFDAGKPGGWIMDLAFRALGNPPRDGVVVIGDRIDTDVEMARRYGVRSILVLTGLTRAEDLKNIGGRLTNTTVVRDLSELRI